MNKQILVMDKDGEYYLGVFNSQNYYFVGGNGENDVFIATESEFKDRFELVTYLK